MTYNFNWNSFLRYIFFNILKISTSSFLIGFRSFNFNFLLDFLKSFKKKFKNLFINFFIKNKWHLKNNFIVYKLELLSVNFLNINFIPTFFSFTNFSGTPYKKFYPWIFEEEDVFFKVKYILKADNYCCNLSDVMFWFKGVFDIFFFNFFFIFNFFLKRKIKYIYNNLNYYKFLLNFIQFDYPNWLKEIIFFRRFVKSSLQEKLNFFRELSKRFWQTWLFYSFDHYIQIKRDWIYFLWSFFFIIEISSIFFFYFFISLFFSNFFWIFDWYGFRMERFGLIFDFFLLYIWNELDFNFIYLFINFYLFRVLINAIDCRIAVRKSIERIYGKFLNFDVLLYYFDNLINNTTLIDFWLIKNNLDGKKVVKIFVLVLSSFNKTFNVCRRPFHSFFNRFYDILFFLKKIKNNRKVLKKFYRILLEILNFIRINKLSLRKKSIKGKPLRRSLRIGL